MVLTRFKDGRVHSGNSRMNGLMVSYGAYKARFNSQRDLLKTVPQQYFLCEFVRSGLDEVPFCDVL